MKNYGLILTLVTAMLLTLWVEAEAQWVICYAPAPPPEEIVEPVEPIIPPGGTGLPVYDAANTLVNTITATRAGEVTRNQERQIALDKQNLVHVGHCVEDTGRLMRLLDEVLQYEKSLHYQLPSPGTTLDGIYKGFNTPTYSTTWPWWNTYQGWTETAIDTQAGTLETVHYQLRPERQAQEEELLSELLDKSQNATGNLDATQIGNMITLQLVEEQRKLRQLLGATMNAQNVGEAQRLTKEAFAVRIEHDWVGRTVEEVGSFSESRGYGMGNFGPGELRD
jgi:P-type conjugative transfer protein TrbJ